MQRDILACLLNYKRPDNLRRIIAALREQTVPVRIAVWNNGDPAETFPGADYQFASSENLICLPRWHVAALLGKQYVFSLDDDLLPRSPTLLEECVRACSSEGNRRIIGYTGKRIGPAPSYYTEGPNARAEDDATPAHADIVKGQFMFFHVQLLNRVPLFAQRYEGRGDDIWISLATGTEAGHHRIPAFVRRGLGSLPDPEGAALRHGSRHYARRNKLVTEMLNDGLIEWMRPRARDRVHRSFWRWVMRVSRYGANRKKPAD